MKCFCLMWFPLLTFQLFVDYYHFIKTAYRQYGTKEITTMAKKIAPAKPKNPRGRPRGSRLIGSLTHQLENMTLGESLISFATATNILTTINRAGMVREDYEIKVCIGHTHDLDEMPFKFIKVTRVAVTLDGKTLTVFTREPVTSFSIDGVEVSRQKAVDFCHLTGLVPFAI